MRNGLIVIAVLGMLVGLVVPSLCAEPDQTDLAVSADMKSADAELSAFFDNKLQYTPDTMPNHVFMLMDQEKYEAAITKADQAMSMFPGDAQVVADCAPTAARCYALLGRDKAGIIYIDQVAAKYANDITPVGGHTTLGKWLALCAATQRVWTARRNGDYAAAAKASDGLVDALQKAAEGRQMETLDVYSILNAMTTQGRMWESAGKAAEACAAYERALAFVKDRPQSGETNVRKQTIDQWRTSLPSRIARCKQPGASEDQDAAVDRVDWLIQDGKWQLSSGRNYTAAIARFEEAVTDLNKLDLSKLGTEREDKYRHLKDEELPNEVKLTKEDNDHRVKVRKLIEQGQAEKAAKPN